MKKVVYFLSAVSLATVIPTLCAAEQPPHDTNTSKEKAPFKARDFSSLLGMEGFSDEGLRLHFKLYEGYVKNTNLMLEQLATLSPGIAQSEIKRRLMWEYNGMRLHEKYFENLGSKTPIDTNSALYKKIVADFGSFDNWKSDFVATGAMRGIGWVILYLDPVNQRLVNVWINEHDVGHLAGAQPLLVMDVFEHAYLLDYGIDRAHYIDAFFKNVNWAIVSGRYVPTNTPRPS